MHSSAYSADVSLENFDTLVLHKSHEIPVLVDFWAAWCGPCKMLMPLLAKLADEYAGKFFLAKVDTDVEQKLAGKYGIRSLPTVKLFKDGQVVGEFMGVQPERAIRELLDKHVARESDAAVREALLDHQQGRTEAAITRLRAAMQSDPANDRVKLELGRILLEQGRSDEGEQVLGTVSRDARAEPAAAELLARLEFVRIASSAPSADDLKQRIAADPNDIEARHQLSARLVVAGEFQPALDHLLEIVKRDRRFGEDAGRKGVLTVFNLLGGKGELVKKYRALLSMALH